MKLKHATLLGAIGMIIQMIVTLSYFTSINYDYHIILVFRFIADAFLLVFFLTLFKKQQ